MSSEDYPRRRPDVAFRPVGDEGGLVVLSDQAEVKVLNPVGSFIFGLLDGEHSRGTIIERMLAEFEIDAVQAEADLDAFIADLDSHGMMASAAQETHG